MTVKRLVDVSVQRDTPLDVLAACREVCDTAELIYVGHGRWWLGYIRASAAMDIGYPPPGQHGYYQHALQRQGFRFLGEYGDDFLTPSYLRDELAFMLGRTDAELAKDFQHAEDVSSGVAVEREQADVVRDKIHGDGRSIFAHVMRKRRSVLVPATITS